jgi:glycosyltransferase involved in cell wall biosynthesis
VVATDIRGTDEAIGNGRTGLLIPPDNEQALASGIARLFQNRKLAEQLAEKALAAVREKFTWGSNLVKLEAELEKVI